MATQLGHTLGVAFEPGLAPRCDGHKRHHFRYESRSLTARPKLESPAD
jgi:hypothetical protein